MRGKRHPRFGAEWKNEQRIKFQLTMYNRQREQLLLRMFLENNKEWEQFKQETKI